MHFTRLWPALAYWVVCGVSPTALLLLTYPRGRTYVALYSHLFLYPLFFGWISVALALTALPFASNLLREWRRLPHFWAGIAIFSVAAMALDLASPNTAPWEISPRVLAERPVLADHFETEDAPESAKVSFQKEMNALMSDFQNWSLSRYLYVVSFLGQSAALLLVFFVSGVLVRYRLSADFRESDEFRASLTYAALSVLVCFLYSLMRLAFSDQKMLYYPKEANPAGNWVILALFVVAIIFLAACFWLWIGKHLAGVISLVFGGSGFLTAWKYPKVLVGVFGKNAGFLGYGTILIGMLAVGYVWLLVGIHPNENGRTRRSTGRGKRGRTP